MIRVYIADDHSVVRAGIRSILAEQSDFTITGEASNGRQVLLDQSLANTDVLILDMSMPRVDGTEVLRRIVQEWPELKIVVHSMFPANQLESRVRLQGASAYVCKDRPASELIAAVRQCMDSPLAATPISETKKKDGLESLTAREHQIFLLFIHGRSVVELAAELDLHPSTISNHLAKIRMKLSAPSTTDLMRLAIQKGFIAPLEPPHSAK